GSGYLSNSDTRSPKEPIPFWASGSRSCPPRSLLGHVVTGPRRLRGHAQSAALLVHA
ncbi:unnamed protein product, partial [Staurois parvus]